MIDMTKKQKKMYDKLIDLDGPTILQLFLDYHGTQLLDDGFYEEMGLNGLIDEDEEGGEEA
jgi:hypothetical protein